MRKIIGTILLANMVIVFAPSTLKKEVGNFLSNNNQISEKIFSPNQQNHYNVPTDVKYVIKQINSFKAPHLKFKTDVGGSHLRNTSIKTSDWDLNVRVSLAPIANNYKFAENDELLTWTNPKYKIPDSKKIAFNFKSYKEKFLQFKNDLHSFLTKKAGFKTKIDNKVIKLTYKNEEYDIAPTFEYKFKTSTKEYSGSSLVGQNDAKLYLNFNNAMSENFAARDKTTSGHFTEMIKAMKTVKSNHNIKGSSIGFENFLSFTNNRFLNKSKYHLIDLKNILKNLNNNYINKYDTLYEVTDIIRLNKFLTKNDAQNIINKINHL